jgi:hypothetical protein
MSWQLQAGALTLSVGWLLALAVAFSRLARDVRDLERRIRWMETHGRREGGTAFE